MDAGGGVRPGASAAFAFVACALVRATSRLIGMPGGHTRARRFSAKRPDEWGGGTDEGLRYSAEPPQ